MRSHVLFPYFGTREEAIRYFRRGWWRYCFPRFPLLGLVFWLVVPAVESLWQLSPSFSVRWVDLFPSLLGWVLLSVPLWLGYKRSYRDFLYPSSVSDARA